MSKLAAAFWLLGATAAMAQGTGVNPPVGAVWTYLGPTYGAGWAPVGVIMPFSADASPGPPWPTTYHNWDGARFSVNNYPVSGETQGQPGEQLNAPTALMGAINIPANAISTPAAAGFGVWGGALSASPQLGAVGVYGFGGKTANGVSSWGMNPIVTNCPTPGCLTKTGFDGGPGAAMWGVEVDVNVFKTASGAAPLNMAVRGVEIAGASETQVGAGGSSFALSIRPLGVGTPSVPWQTAFVTGDGAALNGMSLGATGMPGSSSGGQQLCWNSYNGTTIAQGSCISTDPGANLLYGTPSVHEFQVSGTPYVEISNQNLVLLPLAASPSSNSVTLLFNAVNNASAPVGASIQGKINGANEDLVLNAAGSGVVLQTNSTTALRTSILPLTAQAGISLIVNNNAGVNLVSVTLGAPDSCTAGYRCLRVPN